MYYAFLRFSQLLLERGIVLDITVFSGNSALNSDGENSDTFTLLNDCYESHMNCKEFIESVETNLEIVLKPEYHDEAFEAFGLPLPDDATDEDIKNWIASTLLITGSTRRK